MAIVLQAPRSTAWSKTVCCSGTGRHKPGCGAVLHLRIRDVFRVSFDSPIYFICPCCWLANQLPSFVELEHEVIAVRPGGPG